MNSCRLWRFEIFVWWHTVGDQWKWSSSFTVEETWDSYKVKRQTSRNHPNYSRIPGWVHVNWAFKAVIFSLWRQWKHDIWGTKEVFMCMSEPHTHPHTHTAPPTSLRPRHLRHSSMGQTATWTIGLSKLTVSRGKLEMSLWCHSGWATSHWVT